VSLAHSYRLQIRELDNCSFRVRGVHLNDKGIKKGLVIDSSLDAILRELPFRSRQLRGGDFVIGNDAVPKLQATQVISFIVPSSPTLHLLFFLTHSQI